MESSVLLVEIGRIASALEAISSNLSDIEDSIDNGVESLTGRLEDLVENLRNLKEVFEKDLSFREELRRLFKSQL